MVSETVTINCASLGCRSWGFYIGTEEEARKQGVKLGWTFTETEAHCGTCTAAAAGGGQP